MAPKWPGISFWAGGDGTTGRDPRGALWSSRVCKPHVFTILECVGVFAFRGLVRFLNKGAWHFCTFTARGRPASHEELSGAQPVDWHPPRAFSRRNPQAGRCRHHRVVIPLRCVCCQFGMNVPVLPDLLTLCRTSPGSVPEPLTNRNSPRGMK